MRTPGLVGETEAIKILTPYKTVLADAFSGAFADWAQVLASCPTETGGLSTFARTRFIHDRVVYRLMSAEAAGQVKGLRVRKIGGLYVVVLNDRLALKLKKLSKSLRSRNIQTLQTRAFDNQAPVVPSETGRMTNATGGYVADSTTAESAEIVVVCWDGASRQWVVPLTASAAETIYEIPAEPATEIKRTRVVAPAKKARDSDGSQ